MCVYCCHIITRYTLSRDLGELRAVQRTLHDPQEPTEAQQNGENCHNHETVCRVQVGWHFTNCIAGILTGIKFADFVSKNGTINFGEIKFGD